MARAAILGSVAWHRLPCPSDADPFPNDGDDDDRDQRITACELAISHLTYALRSLNSDDYNPGTAAMFMQDARAELEPYEVE